MIAATACPPPPPPPPEPTFELVSSAPTTGAAFGSYGALVSANEAGAELVAPLGTPDDSGDGLFFKDLGTDAVTRLTTNSDGWDGPSVSSSPLGLSPEGRWSAWTIADSGDNDLQRYRIGTFDSTTGETSLSGYIDARFSLLAGMAWDGASEPLAVILARPTSAEPDRYGCSLVNVVTNETSPCTGFPGVDAEAAISASGQFVAYFTLPGAGDAEVRVWNRSNDEVSTYSHAVLPIAISDDGTTVLGAVLDPDDPGAAPSWSLLELATGNTTALPTALQNRLNNAEFSPRPTVTFDRNLQQVMSAQSPLLLWDSTTGATETVQGDSACVGGFAAITDPGRICVISSETLVSEDTNDLPDAYLVELDS